MLSVLAIANYRSLRELVLPLGRLTVITGANGSGKSSVYRSLRLLADTAQGGIVRSLAREGGMNSVLWAGPEQFSAAVKRGDMPIQGANRSKPVNLRLGFAGEGDSDFGYAIDVGLPVPAATVFNRDPEIKTEVAWNGPVLRLAAQTAKRDNALLQIRDDHGKWSTVNRLVPAFASMLYEYADPRSAPELLSLREQVRSWRFYDHFRTDSRSPARIPQIGTRTPVLDHDGGDLAAALATIREIGDEEALDEAVADAFEGCSVDVVVDGDRFSTTMRQKGLLRPLQAAELSDGTLRYLLWVAALLTPRPPPLLVLNEPETSLHPDLLPALGRLIVKAARSSQIIVVSHAARLVSALEAADAGDGSFRSLVLEKEFGETRVLNLVRDEVPVWRWPSR